MAKRNVTLMVGPPRSEKAMRAKRFVTILPPLPLEEKPGAQATSLAIRPHAHRRQVERGKTVLRFGVSHEKFDRLLPHHEPEKAGRLEDVREPSPGALYGPGGVPRLGIEHGDEKPGATIEVGGSQRDDPLLHHPCLPFVTCRAWSRTAAGLWGRYQQQVLRGASALLAHAGPGTRVGVANALGLERASGDRSPGVQPFTSWR
jgi:hypothetical protein